MPLGTPGAECGGVESLGRRDAPRPLLLAGALKPFNEFVGMSKPHS